VLAKRTNNLSAVVGVSEAHQQHPPTPTLLFLPFAYLYFMEDIDLFEHRHISFFTATILEWKHLLKPDKYKELIISSLSFLVKEKRANLYGFVIMPNHIHLLWKILPPHNLEAVQRDFLKYVAQQIRRDLAKHHPKVLPLFEVNAKDRKYQIWERNPLSVYCYSEEMIAQKLNYIHLNPIKEKWGLATVPEDYHYSSAKFYIQNITVFDFLTHYLD
jgi:REP element-mobilizing transposase RayT